MRINSTYTIAIELLLMCANYTDEKITSGFVSRKIGADSAVVRRVMLDLKAGGLIETKPGPSGTVLKKELKDITLFEVLECVTEKENILKFYDHPSNSSFETGIIDVAGEKFESYIDLFYNELKNHNLQELFDDVEK